MIIKTFVAAISLLWLGTAVAQTNIKNDIFWDTAEGSPIYSQGGGIFKFPNATGKMTYYWYGVNYEECETYRNAPQ